MALRVLWVPSELRYPPNAGSYIYSDGLIRELDAAGAVVGVLARFHGEPDLPSAVRPIPVEGADRRRAPSLLSPYPLMTARMPLRPLQQALRRELTRGRWDVVVIDHLKGVWALGPIRRHRRRHPDLRVVYASQNVEAAVRWEAVRASRRDPGLPLRFADAARVALAQRRVLGAADVVSSITSRDADAHRLAGASVSVVASPRFSAGREGPRRGTDARPDRVLVSGSFHWTLKMVDLERLLALAERAFVRSGTILEVVGSMPATDLARLRDRHPWARLVGPVPDLAPHYASAAVALVAEPSGGGFKMKLLDLVAAGVPVVATGDSVDGLPEPVLRHMAVASSTADAIERALDLVGRRDVLDRMAAGALAAARETMAGRQPTRDLLAALDAQGAGR